MVRARCRPRPLPVGNRRLRAQLHRRLGAEHTAHLLGVELAVAWRQIESLRAELLQARSQADPALRGSTREAARAAMRAVRAPLDPVR